MSLRRPSSLALVPIFAADNTVGKHCREWAHWRLLERSDGRRLFNLPRAARAFCLRCRIVTRSLLCGTLCSRRRCIGCRQGYTAGALEAAATLAPTGRGAAWEQTPSFVRTSYILRRGGAYSRRGTTTKGCRAETKRHRRRGHGFRREGVGPTSGS